MGKLTILIMVVIIISTISLSSPEQLTELLQHIDSGLTAKLFGTQSLVVSDSDSTLWRSGQKTGSGTLLWPRPTTLTFSTDGRDGLLQSPTSEKLLKLITTGKVRVEKPHNIRTEVPEANIPLPTQQSSEVNVHPGAKVCELRPQFPIDCSTFCQSVFGSRSTAAECTTNQVVCTLPCDTAITECPWDDNRLRGSAAPPVDFC